MKNILFLFAVIVSYTFSLNAQTLDWARKIDGISSQSSYKVLNDQNKNVVIMGTYSNYINFENDSSPDTIMTGNNCTYIAKYDQEGYLLWAKSYGDSNTTTCNSICMDLSDNIYITGYFSHTIDIDPGTGVYNLVSNGYTDIFIAKLDNTGNLLWAKSIGSDSADNAQYINVDTYGNVIITGSFKDSLDLDPGINVYNAISNGSLDIFILKLNSNGDFVWAKTFGSSQIDEGRSIAICNSSDIILTGNMYNTVDFNTGTGSHPITSAPGPGVFLLKLDPNGNFIWVYLIGRMIGNPNVILDINENIVLSGNYGITTDFDPGPGVYNLQPVINNVNTFLLSLDSAGLFRWVSSFYANDVVFATPLYIDSLSYIYHSGMFLGEGHWGGENNAFSMTSHGDYDAYIAKFDSLGEVTWVTGTGGSDYDLCPSVCVDSDNNLYAVTTHRNDTIDICPGPGQYFITPYHLLPGNDAVLYKLKMAGVTGRIYSDVNQNCIMDNYETGIKSRIVRIEPGNIVSQTGVFGEWFVDSLPAGVYTAFYDTSDFWDTQCPTYQQFTVTNPDNITIIENFGQFSTNPCAIPEIFIYTPNIRRCGTHQNVSVYACNSNYSSQILYSAYADIDLSPYFTPYSSTIPYTNLGNSIYRFQIGDINPGQCIFIDIICDVSCDPVLGQTICVQANLFPSDTCAFDSIPSPYPGGVTPCTLPWDHSSLSVEGYCQNDSIYFIVHNTGSPLNGNMLCWSPVRIYVDGYLVGLDSVMIAGGDSVVFVFDGDGRTWRLEADQHPLHPGNSHPNATVELCGDSTNWTPGLVNVLPQNDSDPVVDIYCGVVTGSYDPNDKTGFPTGVDYYHYILPNQQIQYVVRFQNTGTDTAFTVIVRDTLDTDLNIFSVTPGVASHDYHFYMHGPRVLEWTFYNIMLPDSNINQEASHGFLTFTVDQNADLPNGTVINNSADIYFDFNAPVITNQTIHTVNENMQMLVHQNNVSNKNTNLIIYPNPSDNTVFIDCYALQKGSLLYIYDINGALMQTIPVSTEVMQIDVSRMPKGVYVVKSVNENGVAVGKMVVR